MNPEISEWPLLLVSGELNAATDDGFRQRELAKELEEKADAVVGWNPHCIINAIETLVDGEDWAKPCDAVEEY